MLIKLLAVYPNLFKSSFFFPSSCVSYDLITWIIYVASL
jgi:hypothetical protein